MGKENYRNANGYEEMDISRVPSKANVILSHHFFHIKNDGEACTLKLKCRVVSQSNREKKKSKFCFNYSTAQFPALRIFLSLEASTNFIVPLLISGAHIYKLNDFIETSTFVFPDDGHLRGAQSKSVSSQRTASLSQAGCGSFQ